MQPYKKSKNKVNTLEEKEVDRHAKEHGPIIKEFIKTN